MEIQSPYEPHFGGVWERLIQSAKKTLLLILGPRRLSFDTFLGIMVETESILNSRPLTNVAEQPDNEEPLTPNHFLIQRPFNSLPPGQFGDKQPASLKTWKNTQKLMNHIWRRMVEEYLPTLSRRSKWSNSNDRPLKVDDVVWVLQDQTPRKPLPPKTLDAPFVPLQHVANVIATFKMIRKPPKLQRKLFCQQRET